MRSANERQHLASLLDKTLADLEPLVERAAVVLDQRGSRDLRNRIAKELTFARNIANALRRWLDDEPSPPADLTPLRRPDHIRLVVDNGGAA